jgi:HSP20 family protein
MLWMSDFYSVGRERRGQWNPSYDFHESEDVNRLSIEMPGVSRGDVKVNVKDRILTVEAHRNLGRGEQKWKGQWMLSERVNSERIEAQLDAGVLSVSFSMNESSKPREIEIR